jgi:hypothetical protein
MQKLFRLAAEGTKLYQHKNCVEIAVHKLSSTKKKCDVCSVKEISYCNFLKILILCSKRRQTKLLENPTLWYLFYIGLRKPNKVIFKTALRYLPFQIYNHRIRTYFPNMQDGQSHKHKPINHTNCRHKWRENWNLQ